jgi:transcriptional regulator with XRE-family HTH domain
MPRTVLGGGPHISRLVRAARVLRGLTQGELGRLSRTSRSTVARLERGLEVSGAALRSISAAIGVELPAPSHSADVEGE